GFGTGGDLSSLKKDGFICYGLEINKIAYKHAVKGRLFKSFLGNGEKTSFKEKQFDLIFHQGVLEHFRDPSRFMSEHYRILKPGGTIVIDVPHKWNLYTLYRNIYKLFGCWYGGWERSYNARELKNLAWRSGFKPIAIYYRGIWPHRWGKFLFPERIIKRRWIRLVIDKPPVIWIQKLSLALYRISELIQIVSSYNIILVAKRRKLKLAVDVMPLNAKGGAVRRYVREILSLLPKDDYAFVKRKPDIYHATNNWGIPVFRSFPIVTTIHDVIPLAFNDYFKKSKIPLISKLIYRLKMQTTLWLSRVVICTDAINAKEIIKNFLVDSKKISIIPMAVSNVFFEKRNENIGRSYILNHGGLEQRKNIEKLIRSFSLTKDLELIITGENFELVKDLKKLVSKLKISGRVKFVGWVSERKVATMVKNAKCVVYSSLAEGFGLPMLEAMAAGTPIVASNIPILRKIGEEIPIYVNPNSTSSIYKGIIKAISGIPKSRLSKGKAIARNYTWEKVAKKTYEVYFDTIFRLNQ
ncbi:MAG: glycosyltransferase, partial [Patescibacteria group bacterium]